jgi:hypothetical protein
MISLVMRPVIDDSIPIALLDAPAAGTGKGLLANAIVMIASGRRAGTMVEAENEAEWRKKITSALMTGRIFHLIDNVERPLQDASLSSLLTTPEWNDRLLGTNTQISIHGAALGIWCATGNNITLDGDMPRRCYHIRIDAKRANPFLRAPEEFKHPRLLKWVDQERPALLSALLTVCRAWFTRGRPTKGAPTLGSYEEWTEAIWGVLSLDPTRVGKGSDLCYGACFLENGPDLWSQGSTDADEWEPFLRVLKLAFEDQPGQSFTLAQLGAKVRGVTPLMQNLKEMLPGDLLSLVDKGSFSKHLSHAFRRHNGTRYGNEMWRIERAGKNPHTGVALWIVRKG